MGHGEPGNREPPGRGGGRHARSFRSECRRRHRGDRRGRAHSPVRGRAARGLLRTPGRVRGDGRRGGLDRVRRQLCRVELVGPPDRRLRPHRRGARERQLLQGPSDQPRCGRRLRRRVSFRERARRE